MIRFLLLLLLPLLSLLPAHSATQPDTLRLSSPHQRVQMNFWLDAHGRPYYSLALDRHTVIHPSRLGLTLEQNLPLDSHFCIDSTAYAQVDTTWTTVWGQERHIRDHHRELFIALRQPHTDYRLHLRFRLFDDAWALRYEYPAQPHLRQFVIQHENTQYALHTDAKAFWLPGDYDTNEYPTTTSPLSQVRSLIDSVRREPLAAKAFAPGLTLQTPLMLRTPQGVYINLHEAAQVDYPVLQLALNDTTYTFTSHLTPDRNGHRAYVHTGTTSPWRTILLSRDARRILASRTILNLNEPCKITDTSWIRPMKYIGVWWEYFTGGGSTWAYTDQQDILVGRTDYRLLPPNGHHGANTAHVKDYIDFAARHGFDAVLVEGWNEGWEDNWAGHKEHIYSFTRPYPDFDIAQLSTYARQRGVSLIMHHETTSSVVDYERQMEDAFRYMNRYNYPAVKTGYVGPLIPRSEYHDGQWMSHHYLHVVQRAAAHHLMVNSHEASRPTGLCRTYPNWLAQESARGTEFESFSGNRPDHTTILPFTRLIGGPMDYTPGIFEGDLSRYGSKTARLSTTLAKQLALYVTMYSPLQMAADLKENYERFPDAFQFIKDVAVDWDTTCVLAAEPGDYLTIARRERGGKRWFVGAITDEHARTAPISLSFLPRDTVYLATIYADAPDADYQRAPQRYTITQKRVTSADTLHLRLARSGGAALSLQPIDSTPPRPRPARQICPQPPRQ